MSETEAIRGVLKLIPTIGDNKKEKAKSIKYQFEEYDAENDNFHHPDIVFLGNEFYRIEQKENLQPDNFCLIEDHGDGSVSFIASWHNGGASLEEVLEESWEETNFQSKG